MKLAQGAPRPNDDVLDLVWELVKLTAHPMFSLCTLELEDRTSAPTWPPLSG
eukprot:CAMPEP_0115558942 /NCGR_PEP_ID=MMETSP0271-20121206/99705_1 /TAXON_ID=71861 /ORGANISM="Scrippsiella trochoidea, Strain CCMP3099" /LENGTH=51 /DNA_ID=CAMNT_0002992987 /DNA_START=485 /DNA_END=637 /DNA_ORIENTATION=-